MNSNPGKPELPTYFISHGGGPWPFIPEQRNGVFSKLAQSLVSLPAELGSTPRAVLAISGHWEENEFTVMTGTAPPMVYDYSGFPRFTYSIQYAAHGSPAVADRVQELLESAGIPVQKDPNRGYDHGIFSPFALIYPDADVPILQLSLKKGYDPAIHLAAGRALAPLRKEGILIVGSGSSYHNLRQTGSAGHLPSHRFDAWLDETLCRHLPADRGNRGFNASHSVSPASCAAELSSTVTSIRQPLSCRSPGPCNTSPKTVARAASRSKTSRIDILKLRQVRSYINFGQPKGFPSRPE